MALYQKKRRGRESLFKEITAENFPNRGKELDIQVHEVNRAPYFLNVKIPSSRQSIMKL